MSRLKKKWRGDLGMTRGKNLVRGNGRVRDVAKRHITNRSSFISDVLKGMWMGVLFSPVTALLTIYIWDLMRGSIPLQSLVNALTGN